MIISVPFRPSSVYLLCASALLTCHAGNAHALGLGNLHVLSNLGQTLSAQLEVSGVEAADIDANCFTANLESLEGLPLSKLSLSVSTQGKRRMLNLASNKNIVEPAVKLLVKVSCEVQLHREFSVLLDPPEFNSIALPGVSSSTSKAEPSALTPTPRPRRVPRTTDGVSAPGAVSVAAAPTAEKVSKPKVRTAVAAPRSSGRDTLSLSDQIEPVSAGLKMAQELTVPENAGSEQSNSELRRAQVQFAAMLRDEPVPPASAAVTTVATAAADQTALQTLQREAAQLKQQLGREKAALDEARESSVAKNWVYFFLVLLVACLAIVGLLFAYIRRLHHKHSATWWEQGQATKSTNENRRHIEDLVNSVQATYETGADSAILSAHHLASTEREVSVSTAPQNVRSVALAPLDVPSVFGKNYSPTLEDSNSSTFNFFSTRDIAVKVEEISDVTQEAEFWMSVNDPERAIEILEPQADLTHPESPVPWLYLLDLYKVTANKEKYNSLRDRFIVFFNANVPEFDIDPSSLPARQLDDFEHLSRKVCSVWNTKDSLPFLESLLVDDRDGKRMGFELPVYRDILLLIAIANELERQKTLTGQAGWVRPLDSEKPAPPLDLKLDLKAEENEHVINFELIDFKQKSE